MLKIGCYKITCGHKYKSAKNSEEFICVTDREVKLYILQRILSQHITLALDTLTMNFCSTVKLGFIVTKTIWVYVGR